MMSLTTTAGDAVRENYRRQGAAIERERIIDLIKRQICFDALAEGFCSHHGGKCGELLQLIDALIRGESK